MEVIPARVVVESHIANLRLNGGETLWVQLRQTPHSGCHLVLALLIPFAPSGMPANIATTVGREAQAALDYRKEVLSSFTMRSEARYAPRPDYFDRMTWLAVPVQETTTSFLQTSMLFDCARHAPYVSLVIGVVSTHNLLMNPHGDCVNPSDIKHVSLRFSLSPPPASLMPTFHGDYMTALDKFRLLQATIPGTSACLIQIHL